MKVFKLTLKQSVKKYETETVLTEAYINEIVTPRANDIEDAY